jgi:hypothetical protein
MKVVDYDYIQEISTADALKAAASDVSSWYNWEIPWVNTFKINAETSIYNEQWGWEWLGIAWWSTDVRWTAWVWTISWSSWNIDLPDWTQIQVSSWSANVSAPTYIYVDTSDWTVWYTTHSYEAVWENKIMICSAFPNSWKNVTFQSFWNADQNSLTTGSSIANWTITANNIASNTITANNIASWTITANEIASNTITASEMNVSRLSAISANLWDITAGTITGTTITAWNTSSSAVRMYPSWSSWYLQFYYSWSTVWTIQWQYVSWVGNTVAISGTNIALDWKVWCLSKLRIPVWTNMY